VLIFELFNSLKSALLPSRDYETNCEAELQESEFDDQKKPLTKLTKWLLIPVIVIVVTAIFWQYRDYIIPHATGIFQFIQSETERIVVFVVLVGIYPGVYWAYASFRTEVKQKRLLHDVELFGLISQDELDETVKNYTPMCIVGSNLLAIFY
jgi:hypothetical protein